MKAIFEKIVPPGTNSFKYHGYEKETFDTPWHYHPEYELTYIISSRGVRYTGNRFENFEENDLVLLGPNLPHCWKNMGSQSGKASAVVIHWDADLLGAGWQKISEFKNILRMFHLSARGIKFDAEFAFSIRARLLNFPKLTVFARLISLLEILNELASTHQRSVLCSGDFQDGFKFKDHQRINTIYNFVQINYGQKITLTDISKRVHMGKEPFSRFFSKIMNKPFFSYLNEYRINVAGKLLIESDQSVSQICYECGFESLPFFYRQFKKYKKHTPFQYRKEYLKLENSFTVISAFARG